MCRLAFIPKPFSGMQAWLEQMERSNGGHGTGLAIGHMMVKSVRGDARWAANEIGRALSSSRKHHRKIMPALFHTRWASSGNQIDELCHPFACAGGWLVHNGHWQAAHEQARKEEERSKVAMSDTRLFSLIVDHLGFEAAINKWNPPGVWLHMTKSGRLACWKNGGSLWHHPELGAWGSEPCDGQRGWSPVADGFYAHGEEPYLLREERESVNYTCRPTLFTRTGTL